MKIPISGIEKSEAINFMRRAGYSSLGRGRDDAELSFIRPFGRSGYPRFHLFIRFDKGKDAVLNIHLDQRKPVYSGTSAHGADYEGPRLEDEIERIKSFLSS